MSRREFQFVEGTSSKFWAIELDGKGHTVHFGRIGTTGQASRKDFDDEAAAKASYDKLIAEKVRKGYTEVAGNSGSTATAVPPPKPKPQPKPKPVSSPEPIDQADPPEPATIAEPSPTAVAPEPVVVSMERSIDLPPEDWFWASWRQREPLPRPEPRPFDLELCLRRLAKVTVSGYGWVFHWEKAEVPVAITESEARFWLWAMTELKHGTTPAQVVDRARASYASGEPKFDLKKHIEKYGANGRWSVKEVVIPLLTLRSFEECLELWCREPGQHDYHFREMLQQVVAGFRKFVVPYLRPDERRRMQDAVRARLDPLAMPPGSYTSFPFPWYLAAALGLADEVLTLVRSIPDDHYSGHETFRDHYQRPQSLVLSLGDPLLVQSEWRRLKLTLRWPEVVRGWLATTEYAALDLVRDSILAQTSKDDAGALLEEFARVKAPEAAAPMLELLLNSKAPKHARRWLDENPGHAVAGLILAAGGRGKLADAALDYLREQKKKGRAELIQTCLAAAPPDVAEKVRRDVLERVEVVYEPLDEATTPEDVRLATGDAARLKPPTWITVEDLPRVLLAGRVLNDVQGRAFLAALAKSTLAAPHPLVAAVRAHAEPATLDTYAWSLFDRWLLEGAPSKEKWAMAALGLVGSDAAALKLTPMIRAWPGESQHQRAVFGLECLRAIGTDVALMQLNGIAQKVSFKGLKAKAAEMMEAIADDRKLTRAQLEDRIVPDCDLDERGSRVFDYGPRQFRFVLGGDMKPMVRDPDGKLKTDLPKPGTKDDLALGTAALDAWKLLKKQIKEVGKVQAERLEQAMVTGRRWTPADFESLLVKHPLMTNLVRLLLWGGYDATGTLVSTFRVTEERDYADVHESTTTLAGVETVGLVHPLHLSDAERSAWGEIFGDYEIIPPFPQLGRACRRLEPGEEDATLLERNKGLKVPAVTLVGILERHGWARGIPEDGGVFHQHSKPFEGANVTAVVEYEGVPVGMMVDWDDQEVEKCYFIQGIHTPKIYPDYRDPIPLGRVDPVVLSEVLGTLSALAGKAK